MRLPSAAKAFRAAKTRGRKSVIVYLGDPQSALCTEVAYQFELADEKFAQLSKYVLDLFLETNGATRTTTEPPKAG